MKRVIVTTVLIVLITSVRTSDVVDSIDKPLPDLSSPTQIDHTVGSVYQSTGDTSSSTYCPNENASSCDQFSSGASLVDFTSSWLTMDQRASGFAAGSSEQIQPLVERLLLSLNTGAECSQAISKTMHALVESERWAIQSKW